MLIIISVLCPVDGARGTELVTFGTASITAVATCSPDSIVSRFFALLRSGDSSAAHELFLVQNTDQEGAVHSFVSSGIEFFAKTKVRSRVAATFEDGQFCVCAIEQTSIDFPDQWELEVGCLVREGSRWKLLPIPQNYRTRINGLSPQEISAFDILQEEFSNFKRSYQKSSP